jgi:hypothetical protein
MAMAMEWFVAELEQPWMGEIIREEDLETVSRVLV